jgi:hypothetical protein
LPVPATFKLRCYQQIPLGTELDCCLSWPPYSIHISKVPPLGASVDPLCKNSAYVCVQAYVMCLPILRGIAVRTSHSRRAPQSSYAASHTLPVNQWRCMHSCVRPLMIQQACTYTIHMIKANPMHVYSHTHIKPILNVRCSWRCATASKMTASRYVIQLNGLVHAFNAQSTHTPTHMSNTPPSSAYTHIHARASHSTTSPTAVLTHKHTHANAHTHTH